MATAIVHMRVDERTKARWQAAAEGKGQTLTMFIERAVEAALGSEPHQVSAGGTPEDAAYWAARHALKAPEKTVRETPGSAGPRTVGIPARPVPGVEAGSFEEVLDGLDQDGVPRSVEGEEPSRGREDDGPVIVGRRG